MNGLEPAPAGLSTTLSKAEEPSADANDGGADFQPVVINYVPPSATIAGELTFNIENLGDAAGDVEYEVYLLQLTFPPQKFSLVQGSSQTLQSGESATETIVLDPTAWLEQNDYALFVETSSPDDTNTSNNQVLPGVIIVNDDALPDLQVTDIRFSNVSFGQDFEVTVDITNAGQADAGPSALRVTDGKQNFLTIQLPGIAAGETLTEVVAMAGATDWVEDGPEPLAVSITADIWNDVVEWDDQNNTSTTLIEFSAGPITGTEGDDVLKGTAGDDVFVLSGGADVIDGGDGVDVMDGSASTAGTTFNLAQEKILLQDGTEQRIENVEHVIGTQGDDKIRGDHHTANWLRGEAGNDTMWGLHGNDTLDGGAGKDRLSGHDDDDVLIGGDGNDRMFGHDGDDVFFMNGQGTARDADNVWGGQGADRFVFEDRGADGPLSFERDTIRDWQDGVDLIEFRSAQIIGLDDLRIQDWGNGVKVSVQGETSGHFVMIKQVELADITADDFVFVVA